MSVIVRVGCALRMDAAFEWLASRLDRAGRAPLGWPRHARRRVFVWAPVALVAGCVFLGTAHLANGPAVVAGLVMVAAAFGAVIDDRDDRPGWAEDEQERDMSEAVMDDQARKDKAMGLLAAGEAAVERIRRAMGEADRPALLEHGSTLVAVVAESLALYPEAERQADEDEACSLEGSAWPEDQLAVARRAVPPVDLGVSRLDRLDGIGGGARPVDRVVFGGAR